MRRIVRFCILFAMMSGFCQYSMANEPLVIQTEAWPPLVMQTPSGDATGHDYEVMAEVFEQMGQPFEFSFVPWKRIIANLKSTKADAVLGIITTEERKQFLFFPDEPLSSGGYVFFHSLEHPFEYRGLDSLLGKTIGTIGGYSYSEAFKAAEHFKKDSVVGEGALVSNFRKLLLGRVDLVIANKNVGLYTASSMGIVNQIGYSEKYLSERSDFHIGFSKKPRNRKIAARFSDTLSKFKQTQQYRDILKRYGLLLDQ